MAKDGWDTLFDLGADALAPLHEHLPEPEGPLGGVNRHEAHVGFIGGMLAQLTWGDPPKKGRSKEQKEASIEAARVALETLAAAHEPNPDVPL